MRRSRKQARGSVRNGFTVVELLMVLAVLSISLAVIVPPLQRLAHREQLLGVTRESKQLIHRARFEAIKRGVQTAVALDTETGEIVAFADVHGETLDDPADGLFNPVTSGPLRRTDYELGRIRMRSGVAWLDPDGNTGLESVDGFTNTGDPDPPDDQILFTAGGEARSAGAFRMADTRGNFVELRIAQAGTGHLVLQKWDGSDWREQGDQGDVWTWK